MPQSEAGSGSRLAPAALEGFKNAAAYDAHRPSYPPEAVDALLEKMRLLSRDVNVVAGIGSGSATTTTNDDDDEKQGDVTRIVEIATGTGKFTEALVAAAGRSRKRHQSLLSSSSQRSEGGGGGGGGEISGLEWGGRDLGLEILATEPHPDMLRELEGKRLPGVVVRRGGAEEIGRVVFGEKGEGEGWADGVVAAQAFHW